MKLTRISSLLLFLILLVPSASHAQSCADKASKPFWTKFSSAISKINHVALKRMISKDFFNGGGHEEGYPRNDWLKSMIGAFWQSHKESVATGTKNWGANCRITQNDHLSFKYQNKQWLWTGVMGD